MRYRIAHESVRRHPNLLLAPGRPARTPGVVPALRGYDRVAQMRRSSLELRGRRFEPHRDWLTCLLHVIRGHCGTPRQ
jgi:hypothetical protein